MSICLTQFLKSCFSENIEVAGNVGHIEYSFDRSDTICQLFFNIFLCIVVSVVLCLLRRYQKSTNSYAPYNKDWIKEKIYVLLRRQAARSQWVVNTVSYVPWPVAPFVPTFQDLYLFFWLLCCIDGQISMHQNNSAFCIQYMYISLSDLQLTIV